MGSNYFDNAETQYSAEALTLFTMMGGAEMMPQPAGRVLQEEEEEVDMSGISWVPAGTYGAVDAGNDNMIEDSVLVDYVADLNDPAPEFGFDTISLEDQGQVGEIDPAEQWTDNSSSSYMFSAMFAFALLLIKF